MYLINFYDMSISKYTMHRHEILCSAYRGMETCIILFQTVVKCAVCTSLQVNTSSRTILHCNNAFNGLLLV